MSAFLYFLHLVREKCYYRDDCKQFIDICSFLQDSLDLGHDDLQRTLQQSNMASNPGRVGGSSNGHGGPSPHAVDLNPMEFIGE